MTDGRQYLWYNGQKIFDGWEIRTEILCDHYWMDFPPRARPEDFGIVVRGEAWRKKNRKPASNGKNTGCGRIT